MKKSLQAKLIKLYLTVKRTKRLFTEQSEVRFRNYLKEKQKLSDTRQKNPSALLGKEITETDFKGMQVFRWNENDDKRQTVLFYIHGGCYVLCPMKYHYKAVDEIATIADARVVFPIYPKAPRYTVRDALPLLLDLYAETLAETTRPKQIVLMGDSAGGGLALAVADALAEKNLPSPSRIVLLSPWLDAGTDNPKIAAYEKRDPMLSAWGLRREAILWAGDEGNLKNPQVSPIYGERTDKTERISIFVGDEEIFYPDNENFHRMLEEKGIDHDFIVGPSMNHAYPLYPAPEGRQARQRIAEIICRQTEQTNAKT